MRTHIFSPNCVISGAFNTYGNLLKREIVLLRKHAEKPTCMDKYHIIGIRHATAFALLNLLYHAMKGLACIYWILEQTFGSCQFNNGPKDAFGSNAVTLSHITLNSVYFNFLQI